METSLASLCNLFSLTRYICFHFSSHSFEAAKSVNSSFSSRFAIFWILLKEGARHDGRFHLCIFRTICTKFYWLHDTFHNNTFCSFSGKAHSVFGSFHCLSKYLKWLFFLLEYVRLILGSPFQDAHLHIPKWWLFHLDLNIFFSSAADNWCFESEMTVDVCLQNKKFHYIYVWGNTKFQKIRM